MPTDAGYTYEGTELDLFAEAHNWKAYWLKQIARYMRGRVLEVGAGQGTNTGAFLNLPSVDEVTCLEPDAQLLETLQLAHPAVDARVGTLANLDAKAAFDTIVYIDVLEHIEDDSSELKRAAMHLASGGHLIVLSPAHPWLFTPFDAAIGHYRRYTKPMLRAITPPMLQMVESFYLDSVGMVLASAANKLLLKQAAPTPGQIALWDRVMVPMSRLVDPLLQRKTGKTVVGVWTPQRDGA
ncbi:MAG: class I SAM-dependent methyltransferase [Bacteroidota bacterium]